MKKEQDTITPADGTTALGIVCPAGPYVSRDWDVLGEIPPNEKRIEADEVLPLEDSGPKSLQNKRPTISL